MIPLDVDHPIAIEISAGVDDAVIAADVAIVHRLVDRLSIGLSVGIPLAAPDFGDGRAAAWLRYTVPLPRDFAIPVQFGPAIQATTNDTFSAIALLTDLRVNPGWYGHDVSLAADLHYREAFLTHVASSAYYEDWIYDSPEGWYQTTGRTVRIGGRASVTYRSVQLGLTAGWQNNGRYAILLPPVYAVVDGAFRF